MREILESEFVSTPNREIHVNRALDRIQKGIWTQLVIYSITHKGDIAGLIENFAPAFGVKKVTNEYDAWLEEYKEFKLQKGKL